MNYSLDRFTQALAEIGNPQKNVHTIVISGTNGKGTTTLLISAALTAAKFRVCTFLSPHLQSVTERFLIGLTPAEDLELGDMAEKYLDVAKKFDLSYFEFLTLLVFPWALQKRADFLVLEAGLGGRLDATNVTDPVGCVITNIGLDHTDYLGSTHAEILNEKMGILRNESLVFTGIKETALIDQLEKRCLELDAIYYYAKELKTVSLERSWDGAKFTLNGYPIQVSNPSLGTEENAGIAFLFLRILFPKISMGTIQRAFSNVRTPGRLETVSKNPHVVLSGDHNLDGIENLLATIALLPKRKLRIVCGFSLDKPYEKMFDRLGRLTEHIVVTNFGGRELNSLPAAYKMMGRFIDDPNTAVDEMLANLSSDETLLVTGSLYLVGEIRKRWCSQSSFRNSSL